MKAEWKVNQQEGEEFKCYRIWQITVALLHSNGQLRMKRDGDREKGCQRPAMWQKTGDDRKTHQASTWCTTESKCVSTTLSLRLNGHFPGGPGLAGTSTRMSPFWMLLELRVTDRDVQNRFLNFGSVSVQFLKKTRIRFGMNLVRFGLQKLGSVRIVIYY